METMMVDMTGSMVGVVSDDMWKPWGRRYIPGTQPNQTPGQEYKIQYRPHYSQQTYCTCMVQKIR